MGPSSAGFALWALPFTTTELTELQLTCFCLSLLFGSKESIYGTLQDHISSNDETCCSRYYEGRGGYNTMNDFGSKLKVGGVNITARYKCGFKRLVGCASRVSRMVFTSV